MRLRSSCWTTYWSTNVATWQISVKSSEDSPKPGMKRTKGGGSPRRPGTWPTAARGSPHAAVRHHDDVVLEHPHARRAPAHVHDVALDVPGDLDVVADADRAVHEQVHAGEQVRERVLEGERDGEAADAEGGEGRGGGG